MSALPDPGVLGLNTDGALALYADLVAMPTDARRAAAARALTNRRENLTLYRTLVVERDGVAPPLSRIMAGDELLAEYAVLATL